MSDEICGLSGNYGLHMEPLACAYPKGHGGDHAWASLPTFVNGQPVSAWKRFVHDFGNKVPVLSWEMGDGEGIRVVELSDLAFEAFADDIDAVLGSAHDADDAGDYLDEITVSLRFMSRTDYDEIMEF